MDLGSARPIERIRILFDKTCPKEYSMEISHKMGAGGEPEWVVFIPEKEGAEGWVTIPMNFLKIRLLKIRQLKSVLEGWGMSICEIEMWGKKQDKKPQETESSEEVSVPEPTNTTDTTIEK